LGARIGPFFDYPTVADPNHPIAAFGQGAVVGDQHQGGAEPRLGREQQIDNRLAGGVIEIAGRLVGRQQFRLGNDGAGQGNALLFAAGQLGRVMTKPMAGADRIETGDGARLGIVAAAQFQGNSDVFQRRHGRHQMERLEDDTEMVAAKARQGIFVEGAEVGAGDSDPARRGALEPGDQRQHGRLARAGRADHGNGFAAPHGHGKATQDIDVARPGLQGEVQIVEDDQWSRGKWFGDQRIG